jgi:hypothetical protein
VLNATSPTLSLDVAQNGTVGTGNSNIAFGSASSCVKVNNATPKLTIRPTGTTTDLIGFSPSFAAGGTFTILVTGTQAAPIFTTLDDAFTTPSAGNAAVRIINATSSATAGTGTWDVYVNPATPLGTPNVAGLLRNAATTYLTVPAGQANTIRLTNTGQTATLQNISVPSMTAGSVQTIVVTDAATGSTSLRTFTLQACT